MLVAPRTRIFGAAPKVPLTFCTETPAARPSSERLTSATPSSLLSLPLIFVVLPVKRRLSIFCMPVTTTSSSTRPSDSSWMRFSCEKRDSDISSVL